MRKQIPAEGIHAIEAEYEKTLRGNLMMLCIALILLLGVTLVSLQLGVAKVSFAATAKLFTQILFHFGTNGVSVEQKIVLLLRLPRVLLAVLTGMALSVSGTVMQGITRNLLVSPFTIGVSSAAAFGASIAIVFGFSLLPGTTGGIVVNAFLCAVVCAFLVYGISWKLGMAPETLILTGIALNYLFAALTSVIQYVAEEHQLAAAVQWAFGSLNGADWNQVVFLAVTLILSCPILFRYAIRFNVLIAGGDDLAKSLGIYPTQVKLITGTIAVILTAASISFSGVIGFVGLAGPHIARLLVGGDHRYLIPFSMLTGAILVVTADTVGRILLSPVIIPVGIVISFLGVPLFLNLIITRRTRIS